MASLLNAPVVPKFTLPTAPKPAAAAVEAADARADDLLAALECADDLLAGLEDVPAEGEVPAEAEETAHVEQPRSELAASVTEADGAASVVTEAPAPAPVARKQAPLLPTARKQFAAPSSAKPAAAAESAAGAGAEAADKAKAPRLKTAYTRFTDARRPELKAEQPELSFAEMSKLLGAEWSALSAEAKAPYHAAAEADKAAAPAGPTKPAIKSKPAVSKKKAAAVDAGGAQQDLKPRTISAYTVFCSERRPELKIEQPELPFGELSKALAAEWKELCEEDRLPFALRAAERTASAPPRPAKAPKAPKAPKKRAARSSSPDLDFEHESPDADMLDGEFGAGPAPAKKRAAVDAHGYDWGVDRTKPVAFLVSRLMSGSYVAFRQAGDVLTEEPAVAARGSAAASGGVAEDESAEPALLHSEEQEHDFAIHLSKFKAALSERAEGGSINLDDLGPDSPLGTMLTLEALRFKGGPLDKDVVKNGKNVLLGGMHDAVVKIPACGMSFVVDRLIRGAVQAAVAAERARVAALPTAKELAVSSEHQSRAGLMEE